MLDDKPKLKTLVTRVAPIITALGIIFGGMYTVVTFYADSVAMHEMAKRHNTDMTYFGTSITELNYSLNETKKKIDQLTDQMTLLAAALQYEKDSKEFILLRDRKHQLSTQEIIRYCELFRALKMGTQCDI